jgi:hypothetical protein
MKAFSHWLWAVAGLAAGTTWFLHLSSFDLRNRFRGDAIEYFSIAASFSDLGAALSFAGGRSVGFPLLVYSVMRLFGPVNGPAQLAAFLQVVSWILFVVHVLSSCFFFLVLRRAYAERDGRQLHFALLALLLAAPGMVSHTTVLLTDTFAADLLMIGFALFVLGHDWRSPWAAAWGLVSGLVLGYACLCRPTYVPGVLAVLCMLCAVVIAKLLLQRGAGAWRRCAAPLLCAFGCAALLLTATYPCKQRFGSLCLADPTIVPRLVVSSLQVGLDSPRAYWSAFATRRDVDARCNACRALRDPLLTRTWKAHCQIDAARFGFGVPACLVQRPDLALLFLAKKTIGLFDSYTYQDYAVDLTPSWARLWSRPFGALAFAGLLASLMLFARSLMLAQSFGHIEGRYGYAMVPGALLGLFALLAARKDGGSRLAHRARIALLGLAALAFLAQTATWDTSDRVLQRIESSRGLGE